MPEETYPLEAIHLIWIAGAGCDGCTMAMLGATEPGLEDLLRGSIPDAPRVTLVHPALALESGDAYVAQLQQASDGDLSPFVLVLEGSVLDESRGRRGELLATGHGWRPAADDGHLDRSPGAARRGRRRHR